MSHDPIISFRGEESLQALTNLCRDGLPPDAVMAELGSSAGESTAVFARHGRLVSAIDPWADRYRDQVMQGCANAEVKSQFKTCGLPPMADIERQFDDRITTVDNIIKLKMTGDEALTHISDDLEFLYIDAIHTEAAVRQDIEHWLPKIRPGKLIAGHDYAPDDFSGVVRAANTLLGPPDMVYADTSWVKRIKDRGAMSACKLKSNSRGGTRTRTS